MKRSHEIPKAWLGVWTGAVVFFLLAPLFCIALVSVTANDYISLPGNGVSFKWYLKILDNPVFLETASNSLLLAAAAAGTAMVLGVSVSLALVRYRFGMRDTVQILTMSPLFVPMVMIGLAVLSFSTQVGWTDQASRVFIGHAALTLPYVVRTVSASLTGFDANQELAARNLGATALQAFLRVTLPQLGPGILAGFIFAFIVSFDNVGLSIFLIGSRFSTLPVEIFTYASYNNDPMTAAISVLMIVFSISAVAALEYFFGLQKLMRG